MSAAIRLDDAQRARLLGLIGIDRYVRRGALPEARAEVPATNAVLVAPAVDAKPRSARAPTSAVQQHSTSIPSRPSLLDDPGIAARAPRLLLMVEAPRTPEPGCKHLLEAIRRVLPAHRLLDASDTPAQWPEFTIVLAARIAPLDGACVVPGPRLSELHGNAHAKRELWRALKPVLRALTRS